MGLRYRSSAACFKHTDRAVKHVVGNRDEVTARLIGVAGTGQHVCFCGKPAAFYIVQVEDSKRGKEKSGSPKSSEGKA